MVRAAGHFFGAPHIGASVIDDHILRLTSNRAKFADVDKPVSNPDKSVTIPNKCKYIITYEIVQSHAMDRHGLVPFSSGSYAGFIPYLTFAGCYRGYLDEGIVEHQLQAFIKSLGYTAIPSRSLGFSPPPFGVMAGLGELGRAGVVCSPLYGNEVRVTCSMITDLPVAPSSPINAGIVEFCKSCKHCANNCPSGSISTETEPSWDVHTISTGPMNQSGIRAWKVNWESCTQKQGGPRECMACQPACPFSNMNSSLIHPIVRATAASTPIFNSFFASMQSMFANENLDGESWWKRDLSTYKYDPLSGGIGAYL
jgi:reductive dehalogenase